MFDDEITKLFENGIPEAQDEEAKMKRKERRSMLDDKKDKILKWWASGKSLGFIQIRLKSELIICERSTIHRYIRRKRRL